MGLFGSRTKTTVGTSINRVIEDASLPDSVLAGLTQNLVGDGGQLVESVMDALTTSIGSRAQRMHDYGKNGYLYGLPSGQVYSSFAGKAASKAAIEQQTGTTVEMMYYHFGPQNNLHVGWQRLVDSFGYNATTNELVVLSTSTKKVFLKDMRVIVTDATLDETSNGSLDQWGTPPNAGPTPEFPYRTADAGALSGATPFAVDPSAAADYLRVDTCWTEKEGITDVVKFGSFTISLAGLNRDVDWHQAKYKTTAGKIGYWSYRANTGTYPDVDDVFNDAYSGTGHFFPWTYFRYNKQQQNLDKNSESYKSSRHLLKTINMDYDDICDGIHENPDIADVEQAMMVMSVPANSTDPIEQRYLFDFFNGIYNSQLQQQQSNAANNDFDFGIESSLQTEMNRSSIIIQDARFKMALNWKNIIRRRVSGTIGPVGTYKGGANSVPSSINVPSIDGGPAYVLDTTTPRHWYQFQASPGVYEEVQVFELKMTYYIFGDYTTTGDEDDEILLIPVDISIARGYSIPDREVLYSRALHYVFNSRIVSKLKWYQTGVFKTILVVIAIVVTVISYGAAWESIAAASAAGTLTLTLILTVIMQEAFKYLLAKLAFRLFVKELGTKVAFLVAVVAAIAGAYQAISAGSIKGAPFAKELLSISSGLTSAINAQLESDFSDLLAQQTDFEKYVKQQTKLLDSAKELLDNNAQLAPIIVFGEKPNDFYNRTVHSGNIGVTGIECVTSFVDVALTLPKLSDTV